MAAGSLTDQGAFRGHSACVRRAKLDDRIDDEDEASPTSPTKAWRIFNSLARIIDPAQIAAADEEDVRGRASRRPIKLIVRISATSAADPHDRVSIPARPGDPTRPVISGQPSEFDAVAQS